MSYQHNGGPELEAPEGYDKIGWVAIHRSICDHWLVGFGKTVSPADPTRGAHSHYEAFSDLIMRCRYDSGYVVNNGRKMKVEAGQLLGGVSWLADRWNWSPKKVRWFLDRLEEDQMISRSTPNEKGRANGTFKGNQRMVISICNYSQYQFVGEKKGDRGATNWATKKATARATNVVTQVTDVVDENTSCESNKGDRCGNQKGDQRGDLLNKYNKDSHTDARAYTRTREDARLNEALPPKQMVNPDGSFDGIAIELTAEEHASWRTRFEALSGTWPSPLLVADEFLGAEFERQGIRDPRQRMVRVQAYLAKRNTEAHMLQAQVTATALVKPSPRINGGGNRNGNQIDYTETIKRALARKGLATQ